ncbi:MAG: cation transporter [Micropruina sp.]|uniref:cation transporter n=1 Tax=Micropruina sp. TaxID=2737536 RepID=UPI0039E2BA70
MPDRAKGGESHPFGYGREAYVWSMFAAFGLFTVGSVVSIAHGVQQLGASDTGHESYLIGYIVLAVSFALEGTSFLQALRQARGEAGRDRLEAHPMIERALLTLPAPGAEPLRPEATARAPRPRA